MTKGEIVDEIVIDANMGLQWPLRCPWIFCWVMMMWGWSHLSALEDDLVKHLIGKVHNFGKVCHKTELISC